ncbi:MAG: hypothetical protein CVU44_11845 [Chloroflexi bacterium HGW-Chloroflexi-6]|nr:MAG: hypothetical protein CVU44_11845 [Chloroflexi bacterium HGW-Chloroflexi-6]
MNSIQYEELCRYFLAIKLNLDVSHIQSINIPNPKRLDLPQYNHQIDLYWKDGNDITSYVNIVNAKWRTNSKVDQPDILLLQQVKMKVAAHKAVMLTNTGFTEGAKAVAQDEGIALHIVKPTFDYSVLPTKDRIAIQEGIQRLNSQQRIWDHQPFLKSLDFSNSENPTYIKNALEIASDEEKFVVVVLLRRLEYEKYVKNLIETGNYGKQEDLPIYENEIQRTAKMIDDAIYKINNRA